MTDELKLKVAEAFSQGDIGRSIARIDPPSGRSCGCRQL